MKEVGGQSEGNCLPDQDHHAPQAAAQTRTDRSIGQRWGGDDQIGKRKGGESEETSDKDTSSSKLPRNTAEPRRGQIVSLKEPPSASLEMSQSVMKTSRARTSGILPTSRSGEEHRRETTTGAKRPGPTPPDRSAIEAARFDLNKHGENTGESDNEDPAPKALSLITLSNFFSNLSNQDALYFKFFTNMWTGSHEPQWVGPLRFLVCYFFKLFTNMEDSNIATLTGSHESQVAVPLKIPVCHYFKLFTNLWTGSHEPQWAGPLKFLVC